MCTCGKPTRDGRFVCDDCADEYARILGDARALDEMLEESLIGLQANRTDTEASGSADENPLPINLKAVDVRHYLRCELVRAVRVCIELNIQGSDTTQEWPEDTIASMSRWLLWRYDALTLTDWMPDLVKQLIIVSLDAERCIDIPPEAKYSGPCECGKDLYARPADRIVKCRICGREYAVEQHMDTLKAKVWEHLDGRTVTAFEGASYLSRFGLPTQQKTIDKWNERGLVVARGRGKCARRGCTHTGDCRRPRLYLFGDLLKLASKQAKPREDDISA